MAKPDILLIVGANVGASYGQLRDDIQGVVKAINKNHPPKIKITIDDTGITKKIKSIREQIADISNKNIVIGATGELQNTISTINNSLNALSEKIANIGDTANFNNLAESLKLIAPVIDNLKTELTSLQTAMQNFKGVNLNVGFSGGNAVTRNTEYGKSARQTVSELKEQARSLEEVFKQYTKIADGFPAVMKALQGTDILRGKDIFQIVNNISNSKLSLSKQMDAWREYLSLMQEVARARGIDITPVTSSFTKGADELVENTHKILSGEKELEAGVEKLKGIFGSGISSEVLNEQLATINNSINRVSSAINSLKLDGGSLNSFVDSVNKLSASIENLISTMDAVANHSTSMSEGITSVVRATQRASESLGRYTVSLDEGNRKILSEQLSGLDSKKIDEFVNRLEKLSIAAKSVKAQWESSADAGQRLAQIIIDGANAQGDLVKHTIVFDKETGSISKELTGVVHKAREIKEEIKGTENATNAVKKAKAEAAKIDFGIDTAKFKTDMDLIQRDFDKLKGSTSILATNLGELHTAFTILEGGSSTQEQRVAAYEKLKALIPVVRQQIKVQANEEKAARQANNKAIREATLESKKQNAIEEKANTQRRIALDLLAKITKAQQEWTKAQNGKTSNEYAQLQNYSNQLTTLLNQLANYSMPKANFIAHVKSINDEFARTSSVIRSAGEDTKSLKDRFGALTGTFSMWFSTTRIIMMVYSNIRKMISASIELDKSMTQLQIVTKENDETMTKFGNTAANTARKIGSSITDFTSSVTTFARLGYSIGESSQLAEFTAMLQNVGDIDVSEAQEAITSIVKAFNIGTDQIESVMDKMVVSGNQFPISVSEIAVGMKNASSALAAAGNSFDQSVALLTAANTTINLCRVA